MSKTYDPSFRKNVLDVIEHVAMSKTAQKRLDAIWDSRLLHTGFMYQGSYYGVTSGHAGVAHEIKPEVAESLGMHDIHYICQEWNRVKPSILCWLNACRNISEAIAWLPFEAKKRYLDNGHKEGKLPDFFLEDIYDSEEYQALESLIAFNLIQE